MKACAKIVLIAFILPLFPPVLWGVQDIAEKWDFQSVKKDNEIVQAASPEADRLTHEYRMTQQKHKLYECVILSAAVVICLLIVLKFLTRTNYTATHLVNAAGLVFIIFGTIFVIILSDVDQQLTGAMGILGAVAGYLFGTMKRGGDNEKEPSPPEKKES